MIEIIVPKKWRHVLDGMCGSGGTFDGTARALEERGYSVRAVAINHWSKAIASHQANHPDVIHFCEDIDTVDVESVVNQYLDGYVDYLMLSPECDDFSRAKGGKPVSDQRRHHAHFFVNTITKVPVRRGFVENVWEFTKWGPLCELEKEHGGKHRRILGDEWADGLRPSPSGKRCNRRLTGKDENGQPYEGQFFQAWRSDVINAGWDFRYWQVNAANYGAPTTRERFIGMGCRERGGVFYPAPTHCDPRKMPAADMFGATTLKPWRTAEEIIRKDRLGASLLTSRSKRKDGYIRSPKTLLRLGRGAYENWGEIGAVIVDALTERGLPDDSKVALAAKTVIASLPKDDYGVPIVEVNFAVSDGVVMSSLGGGVADSDRSPVPAITHAGAHTISRAVVSPALVTPYYSACEKSSTDQTPLDTVTAKDRFSLDQARLVPIISAQRENNVPRSAGQPVQTLTQIPAMLVVQPKLLPVVSAHRSHNAPRSVNQPVHTITADMNLTITQPRLSPVVVNVDNGSNSKGTRSSGEPIQTIVGSGELAAMQVKVVAVTDDVVITENFGEREDQLPRYYQQDKPVATVTHRGAGDIARAAIDPEVTGVSRKRLIRGSDGRLYAVDIYSRMFDVDELLDAQGCPPGYIVKGTKTEQKELIGNMVCPPIPYVFVGTQEDADMKRMTADAIPALPTPLADGREPASVRNHRRGAA